MSDIPSGPSQYPKRKWNVAIKALILCSLGTLAPSVDAQTLDTGPDLGRWDAGIVHEVWTAKDGLPVNAITYLVQTRDGYIWAATFDGLVRFDGVRFTVFNSTNHPDLPSNRILRLLEGRDGSLWLGTDRHLVRYRTGRFTQVGPDLGLTGIYQGVSEDRSGRIWVMTSHGLGQMRGDRFVLVIPGPLGSQIATVTQRRDGSIWAGTSGAGLYRLVEEPGSSTMRAILVDSLDSVPVRTLYEDSSGRLWIGTANGVWTEQGVLRKIQSPNLSLREVIRFVGSPTMGAVVAFAQSGTFRITEEGAVAIDSRGRPAMPFGGPIAVEAEDVLWHATGSELLRNGKPVLTLDHDPSDPLSVTLISAMVVDREGSAWFGTRAAGLHRVKPSFFTTLSEPEGISYRNVYTIHQDLTGDVWVGTLGNGLNRIHRDGRITRYPWADGYPSTVRALHADRIDRLWVGGSTGLYKCGLPRMTCVLDDSPALGAAPYALYRDSSGRLWAGYSDGPVRLDGERWTRIPGWPDAGRVRVFAETADGAIWMGTDGHGLVRYSNGGFTPVTAAEDGLPFDLVRALYVDPDGQLWVGTEGRGLAHLDPLAWQEGSGHHDRRIASISVAQGLFDDVIHEILEDDAGRLWMSTNRGIFWVARDELDGFANGLVDHVRSTGYTERDGLRHREANGGVQPAGIRTRDGRLWFPTQDGVAIVNPSEVKPGRTPPPVVVERVVAGDSSSVPGTAVLELGVRQRDLEIEYTALSFLEPMNVQFRYRLDPYDAEWVNAGRRRTAFYTRVPPGRYTFRVMASIDPDRWAGQEASVDLRLAPRFRETRGALILALLAGGLVLAAGYRWRVGNLRRRERELTQVVESRTAELRHHEKQLEERNTQLAGQAENLAELHEARSRLFANLSHEFRTPLTLILGPLRSLKSGRHGPLQPSVREQHDLMLRNSQRLLRLINQILDLSSLQAGSLSLEFRTADLVAFVRAATMAFTPLAEGRDIALYFRSELTELVQAFDPEQLEKVFLNLLSNALKFTEPGGTVEVVVGLVGTWAEIVVRDTGSGIAPEELPLIFDRFHQADDSSTRRFPGTGIGLALAKELVELHGGDIQAESQPGVGSTFRVRLPLATTPVQAEILAPPRDDVFAERFNGADAVVLGLDHPPAGPPAQEEDSGDDRTTVLVVDDNADVRCYVRSILENSYRVTEARDGEEGLETTQASLPDLIVADVMMPRLDGLALGRALKMDPMTDAIPLVLLTARAEPEDHVAGLETGADAYLAKPFDPGVLEATVANLLAQRRLLRERFRQGEAVPPVTTPETPSALERRLCPLVEAQLMEPEFGPEALAAAADMSYHQLYRALRDELGVTPSGFIRRVRVECAAELLRNGAGRVTEIAYAVGFQSLSYFRRSYQERFDASPSEHLATMASPPTPR